MATPGEEKALDTLGNGPNDLGELEAGTAYIELTPTHVRHRRTAHDGARLYESLPVSAITSIRVMITPTSYSRTIVASVVALGLLGISVFLTMTPTRFLDPTIAGALPTLSLLCGSLGIVCVIAAIYLFRAAARRQTTRLEVATPTLTLTWPSSGPDETVRLEEFAQRIEAAYARSNRSDGSAPAQTVEVETLEARSFRRASADRYGKG